MARRRSATNKAARPQVGKSAFHPAFFALRRKRNAGQGGFRYSVTMEARNTFHTDLKENIMNALKHMEAIFVIAAALATVTSFATATTPVLHVAADPVVAKVDSSIPTVVVAAKRLTAAEKAAQI